jgi:PAS domain S-box-containing protein
VGKTLHPGWDNRVALEQRRLGFFCPKNVLPLKSLQEKRLVEILNPHVIGVSPATSVTEAITLMQDNNISCLPVLTGNRPVGILTERNIVFHTARRRADLADCQVRDLMSMPLVTAHSDMGLYVAFNLFTTHEIRHLVVVNDANRAVGMVTQSDIVEHLGYEYFVEMRKLSQIMTTDILIMPKDAVVQEAVAAMAENAVSCLIIVEADRPVGIVTERDIIRLLVARRDMNRLRLAETMSTPVLTVALDTSVIKAAEFMKAQETRRIVAVNQEGRIQGLVTQSDIVKGLESKYIESLKKIVKEKDLAIEETVRELAKKSVYLDNILRSATDIGIAAMELDGRITYYNPTAANILGGPDDEFEGRDVREILCQQNVDLEQFNGVLASIQHEKSQSFIFERQGDDGEEFIEARLSGIWDMGQNLTGYVLILRDITERRRAEAELMRINEELKNFVHVVSHDLKTPLIAIQGFSGRLAKNYQEKIDERGQNYLEHINSSARRMELLISDLLALSKIGQVVSSFQKVPVRAIVEKVVPDLEDRLEEKGIRLHVAPHLPEIQCDGERLCQVFENLLANAVKYMGNERDAEIDIGCEDTGESYRFYVRDNGIGIDPQYHRKIFEKYQRLAGTGEEGTGLGLAIVERIVTSHGGRVWVESARGRGATFYFTVPKEL